jgi:hypothetical protein
LVNHLPDFDFYIVTRNIDYCSIEEYEDIKTNEWNSFKENVSVYYLPEYLMRKEIMLRLIKEVNPDCLYVNGIYSPFFSQLLVRLGQKLDIRTIVAPRGMLSPHALAVKPFKKKIFLAIQNWRNVYSEIEFHATSGAERINIEKSIKNYQLSHLIGNLPRKQEKNNPTSITKEIGELKLVSIARIAKEKGTLEGIETLQKITSGKVHLDLYGATYDDDYFFECEEAVQKLPKNITVEYKGICDSEQVIPLLKEYHFSFLPSEGENYGHSIVESFFANRPVIIRENTPWKNLEIQKVGFDVELKDLEGVIKKSLELDQASFDKMCSKTLPFILEMTNLEKTKNEYRTMFNPSFRDIS